MIDKTLSIVFGYKRILLYYDEECTNEGDRRLTYEVLFVEYEVLFLQASVKLMHCVINVLFFLRSSANKVPACEYQHDHLRLVHPVDQSWKLLRLIHGFSKRGNCLLARAPHPSERTSHCQKAI